MDDKLRGMLSQTRNDTNKALAEVRSSFQFADASNQLYNALDIIDSWWKRYPTAKYMTLDDRGVGIWSDMPVMKSDGSDDLWKPTKGEKLAIRRTEIRRPEHCPYSANALLFDRPADKQEVHAYPWVHYGTKETFNGDWELFMDVSNGNLEAFIKETGGKRVSQVHTWGYGSEVWAMTAVVFISGDAYRKLFNLPEETSTWSLAIQL